MSSLIWFHNDLRLHDNKALSEACKYAHCRGGKVHGMVSISLAEWSKYFNWGLPKADYYLRTVNSLQKDLNSKGIRLHRLHQAHDNISKDGGSAKEYYESLSQRIAEYCKVNVIEVVFMNTEYEAMARVRDEIVVRVLEEKGIACQVTEDQCVVQPGKVLTKTGTPYKVFGQFKKTWASVIEENGVHLSEFDNIPNGKEIGASNSEISDETLLSSVYGKDEYPNLDLTVMRERFPAGEASAMARLEEFLKTESKSYDEDRNFEMGGSRLSAPLAVGSISLKQCLLAAQKANNMKLLTGSLGLVSWISELCWRDFYRHVMVHFPHVTEGKAFRSEYENLPWRGWVGEEEGSQVEADWHAWVRGLTGYPIVDAAMRELARTAWMGNRLRMIVAMFLTKDLRIHWRRGEDYFARSLVDYDYASNNGGWQWSASTGTDAQPYFRIFNPLLQSEKFDPRGNFIKRCIPELSGVKDAKFLHDPFNRMKREDFAKLTYPKPIVDHQEAKTKAISMFTSVNGGKSDDTTINGNGDSNGSKKTKLQ